MDDLTAEVLQTLLNIQNRSGDNPEMTVKMHFALKRTWLPETNRVANPFLTDRLVKEPALTPAADLSLVAGISRSTMDCNQRISSELTRRFEKNHLLLPDATFGVENEMFVPGLPFIGAEDVPGSNESMQREFESVQGIFEGGRENHYLSEELRAKLNAALGSRADSYVRDGSVQTDEALLTPVEQVTAVLQSPRDIEQLQNALSKLNDWGAITNGTSGVHIHTGVKQWTSSSILKTADEEAWDKSVAISMPGEPAGKTITPLQLLFMKQFVINMASVRGAYSRAAANNEFALPNMEPGKEDTFNEEVSKAGGMEALINVVQPGNIPWRRRYRCVNLLAYLQHGTIEVRGFTKKNGASMEIDPNIPIRDIVFLQEMLIKTIDTMKRLVPHTTPETDFELAPDEGLQDMVDEYVQDVFVLQIIHAVGQRDSKRRLETMTAIANDAKQGHIKLETLEKAEASLADVLKDDPLAREFIKDASIDAVLASLLADRGTADPFIDQALKDSSWMPDATDSVEVRRRKSLRSMADELFKTPQQRQEAS
ncbi:amidoligase family protein [Noviherbaspirillum cavernae]|uniref:amidoligase family protein n=1 Tax=Noviherbaspirillum cavernae TaxID=2320862 RepID=UPI0013141B01|nr:amidoligase family protein [Noviherbaspirillum cavernae]